MRIAGLRIVVCRDLFVGGCVRLCPLGAGHQIAFAPILPHPRSPGGKPQRLTARVKIASARPYFPQPRFAGGANFRFVRVSVRLCVRVWCQSDVPNLGAKARALLLRTTASQISPPADEASM